MNEEAKKKHLRIKLMLKIVGILLLIAGLTFAIIGFADFFNSMEHGMPKRFWCCFVGLPMMGIGAMITAIGFKKEITNYMKNESIPVINDMSQEIQPAISNISSAVKSGLDDAITCECGEVNGRGSKFCKNCGKSLISVCPDCGEEIDANSKFCNNCGRKI